MKRTTLAFLAVISIFAMSSTTASAEMEADESYDEETGADAPGAPGTDTEGEPGSGGDGGIGLPKDPAPGGNDPRNAMPHLPVGSTTPYPGGAMGVTPGMMPGQDPDAGRE